MVMVVARFTILIVAMAMPMIEDMVELRGMDENRTPTQGQGHARGHKYVVRPQTVHDLTRSSYKPLGSSRGRVCSSLDRTYFSLGRVYSSLGCKWFFCECTYSSCDSANWKSALNRRWSFCTVYASWLGRVYRYPSSWWCQVSCSV